MLLKVNLANILTIGLIGAIWYLAFRVGDMLIAGQSGARDGVSVNG